MVSEVLTISVKITSLISLLLWVKNGGVMGKEQRKRPARPVIGNDTPYLMERDRGKDVEVERTKENQINQRRTK